MQLNPLRCIQGSALCVSIHYVIAKIHVPNSLNNHATWKRLSNHMSCVLSCIDCLEWAWPSDGKSGHSGTSPEMALVTLRTRIFLPACSFKGFSWSCRCQRFFAAAVRAALGIPQWMAYCCSSCRPFVDQAPLHVNKEPSLTEAHE